MTLAKIGYSRRSSHYGRHRVTIYPGYFTSHGCRVSGVGCRLSGVGHGTVLALFWHCSGTASALYWHCYCTTLGPAPAWPKGHKQSVYALVRHGVVRAPCTGPGTPHPGYTPAPPGTHPVPALVYPACTVAYGVPVGLTSVCTRGQTIRARHLAH